MIDFIPLHEYTHYFDVTILIMILVAVWQSHTGNILKSNIVTDYRLENFLKQYFFWRYSNLCAWIL